jgi:hypothetical protein
MRLFDHGMELLWAGRAAIFWIGTGANLHYVVKRPVFNPMALDDEVPKNLSAPTPELPDDVVKCKKLFQ